jgi:hypothetical protein
MRVLAILARAYLKKIAMFSGAETQKQCTNSALTNAQRWRIVIKAQNSRQIASNGSFLNGQRRSNAGPSRACLVH